MKRNLPRGVKAMVAGAAPPASMIEGLERLGFDLTHVYGLTQVYGPAVVCVKQAAWESRDDGGCNRLREQGSRKVEAGDRGLEHQDRLNDGLRTPGPVCGRRITASMQVRSAERTRLRGG